jgi:hypothetical protein
MLRKTKVLILGVLLVFGVAASAQAFQSAISYAEIDLNSFTAEGAYTAYLGTFFSGTEAYASDSDSYDHHWDYQWALNSWADAYATAGTGVEHSTVQSAHAVAQVYTGENGHTYIASGADATAGGDSGTNSMAFASSYAVAYKVIVPKDATFNISYYLNGAIDGDTDYGFSEAGSGALMAVLGCGDAYGPYGQWLDVATGFEKNNYEGGGNLSLDLTSGEYWIFAGTAAFASAAEAAPVPEPATMLLLGIGLIGLAGLGRKKMIK